MSGGMSELDAIRWAKDKHVDISFTEDNKVIIIINDNGEPCAFMSDTFLGAVWEARQYEEGDAKAT